VAALISKATGVEPYFVGKPNPLMMREALRTIGAHSETTAMIGDPHGHRRHRRHGGGPAHDPRAVGHQQPRERRALPYRPSRIVGSVAEPVEGIAAADSRAPERAAA
jgi:NagD protein